MRLLYEAAYCIVKEAIASEREVTQIFGISRAAYQRYRTEGISQREISDSEVLPKVIEIFLRHRRRYGARRIAADLKLNGITCGRQRVARLLKIAGFKAIQPKSYKPRTTESRHALGYCENLLLNSPEPTDVNQLWVGDITYVPIERLGFGYLATILDRYSRRIVGWSLAETMDETLVIKSLRMAIRERQPPSNLIHHTDRGGQYASKKYRAILKRSSMQQSMSRAGDCYDNAFMESCFGTIKTELQMTEYRSYQDALKDLRSYIHYYNTSRLHSSLGYVTPSQFERSIRN